MQADIEQLKYPIGRYAKPESFDSDQRTEWLSVLRTLPAWIDTLTENLDEYQLATSYREGGWTVRQLVHHLADSHMNAYIRLKLALSEDNPTIKPYYEDVWATLPDYSLPVTLSVSLLDALHHRMVYLLESLCDADWHRTYYHPEHKRDFPIWEMVAMYAWHSQHHKEHIRWLRQRMNW